MVSLVTFVFHVCFDYHVYQTLPSLTYPYSSNLPNHRLECLSRLLWLPGYSGYRGYLCYHGLCIVS
jgi:hypothetical protein